MSMKLLGGKDSTNCNKKVILGFQPFQNDKQDNKRVVRLDYQPKVKKEEVILIRA